MNLSISPEELLESSKKIVTAAGQIYEQIESIKKTIDGLSEWKSSNKELFVSNVTKSIEKMTKMTDAAESYGSVGADVASRVMGVEDDIKKTIMKDSGSM